jgi:hypothetical protein
MKKRNTKLVLEMKGKVHILEVNDKGKTVEKTRIPDLTVLKIIESNIIESLNFVFSSDSKTKEFASNLKRKQLDPSINNSTSLKGRRK